VPMSWISVRDTLSGYIVIRRRSRVVSGTEQKNSTSLSSTDVVKDD
jgi:hypothetical protein